MLLKSLAADIDFYREVLEIARGADLPLLVGGGFALGWYTSIERYTKDLDIFISPEDCSKFLRTFADAGYRTELPFRHWLAKVYREDKYVDLIFSSGNGLARVTRTWFEHAVAADILGLPVQLCAPEEMIWSKSWVMERDRYDGADIAHLLRARGRALDWPRLLAYFGPRWRVLLSHLILFEFIYPGEPSPAPEHVFNYLKKAWQNDRVRSGARVCQGTFLSTTQYLPDIEEWGYEDARLIPRGTMTRQEIKEWTDAVLQQSSSEACHVSNKAQPEPTGEQCPRSNSRAVSAPGAG